MMEVKQEILVQLIIRIPTKAVRINKKFTNSSLKFFPLFKKIA